MFELLHALLMDKLCKGVLLHYIFKLFLPQPEKEFWYEEAMSRKIRLHYFGVKKSSLLNSVAMLEALGF